MTDYCKYIPGDGSTKSLVTSNTNYSGDDFYRDVPNYDDVDELIQRYKSMSIIDLTGGIDKDKLQENTNALNKFVKEETTRIDDAVDAILGGKVKPSKNSSGLPTSYDDLWAQNLVYDAKNPKPVTGLEVPVNAKNPHWAGKYPFLFDRLNNNGGITGAECDKFIRDYNFTHDNFKTSLKSGFLDPNGTDLLGLLNDFYSWGAFSQSAVGMFCSMVPDIFAQVREIVDMFNQGREFVSDVMNFLSQPFAVQRKLTEAAVKAMLERLKEQVLGFVESIARGALQKVKNMTGGWIDPEYMYAHGALSEKFIREKAKAEAFFSKENLERIKTRISGTIKYAAGVFERMDLEEIQFLIMRFCELLQNIEQLFFGITSNMNAMMQGYSAAYSLLSGSGDLATAQALAAGAIRYDRESRLAGIRAAAAVQPYGPVNSSPMAPPGSSIPEDARGVPANVGLPTPEEMNEVLSYEDICDGASPYINFQGGSLGMGPAGWLKAGSMEKVMLIRLAKALGSPLTINCAYRSPAYNASVGGVGKSLHMTGQAFDISMRSNPFTREQFINTARSVGFAGFGFYNTFIHIDTGRPRTWNG